MGPRAQKTDSAAGATCSALAARQWIRVHTSRRSPFVFGTWTLFLRPFVMRRLSSKRNADILGDDFRNCPVLSGMHGSTAATRSCQSRRPVGISRATLGSTAYAYAASVCGFVLSAMLGSQVDARYASVHTFGVDIISRPGTRQSLVRCLPRLLHENMWIFQKVISVSSAEK